MKTVIRNSEVHDGLGNVFRKDVLLDNGRIAAIEEHIPGDGIDADGLLLFPGLIDPNTVWGINGSSSEIRPSSEDNEELSDPMNPQLMIVEAFNGRAISIQQLPAYGITACGVVPGESNILGGMIGAFYTDGKNPYRMCLNAEVGMKACLGQNVLDTYGTKKMKPMTKMEMFFQFREFLRKADLYRKTGKGDEEGKLRSFAPVLAGKIPLFLSCDSRADRERAVEIISNYKDVRIVFTTANEISLQEAYLYERKNAVIQGYDCMNLYPTRKHSTDESLLELHQMGTDFALSCRCGTFYGRENLLWSGIRMVKAIQDEESVLTMMTSTPARILGIQNITGSIEVGKNADMVLWSENPLQSFRAEVVQTFICGNPVYQRGDAYKCYY